MAFNWSVFAQLAQILAPAIISVVNPKLTPIAGSIAAGIAEAEKLFGAKTGADKLKHVLSITDDAATAVNGAAGKTVVDPNGLHEAATEAIDLVVSIVNLANPVVAANVTKS